MDTPTNKKWRSKTQGDEDEGRVGYRRTKGRGERNDVRVIERGGRRKWES